MLARLTALATVGVVGCASTTADHTAAPLAEPPRVVVQETLEAVPEGGDGPDTVSLALDDERGRTPIEGRAFGGAPFLGGALVLRPDRSLEMVREGRGSVIDRDVVFAPVTSSDGEHAAWAAEHGPEPVLVVIDRDGSRFDAVQGLVSIGALVFDPATHGASRRIAFVGARNGGIAGVWAARVDGRGLSCLTNCELRVGQPLGPEHVPLPTAPLRFEGDALVSTIGAEAHTLPLPEVLR
ncbi:MAG: hypothetical protein U0353_03675 [Sandaracinus sp.]